MRMSPVMFRWCEAEVIIDAATGEVARTLAMVPTIRYRNLAKRQFHIDAEYPLAIIEERSRPAHSRYFAALNDAFENLPEGIAARFPTAMHFRKWLLIEAGWFVEKEFRFKGHDRKVQARRLATYVRTEDEYARITISDIVEEDGSPASVVIIRKAQSQDHSSMDKEKFKASSDAVLDLAAHFIQVPRGKLLQEAGQSA